MKLLIVVKAETMADTQSSGSCVVDAIIDLLQNGKNVFLTGSGGSGKTYTIRKIIESCASNSIVVAQCATTGIAAIQLPNGRTLHSTFCLPIDFPDADELVKRAYRVRRSARPKSKLAIRIANETDILIIDEISMASAWLMDCLDVFLRIFRKKHEPFGGLVILAVGDFLQLPPVYRKSTDGPSPPKSQNLLAFESKVWKTILPQTVLLTEVKRQSEKTFLELLSKIRFGFSLTIQEKKMLSEKIVQNDDDENDKRMLIAVTRKKVFEMNEERFRLLQNEGAESREYVFPTIKMGPKDMIEELEKDLRENLYLSQKTQKQRFIIGQRVMCISNIDNNGIVLVNGDTGTIVKFYQMPPNAPSGTCLLYLDAAEELLKECHDTNFKTLFVPVVRFDRLNADILVGSKKYSRQIYATASTKKNGMFTEAIEASMNAFPLISCFACTTHKVQGCTLSVPVRIDCLHMDWFTSTFYVALSRSTSLDNVTLSNFHGKFKALEKGRQFYMNGKVYDEKNNAAERNLLAPHVELLLRENVYFYFPTDASQGDEPDNYSNIFKIISETLLQMDKDEETFVYSSDEKLSPCLETTEEKKSQFENVVRDHSTGNTWKSDTEIILYPILHHLEKKYQHYKEDPRKRKHILHTELESYLKRDSKKAKQ